MAVLRVAVARSLRRLAGALALAMAAGSAAGAEPAPRALQDPHYGDGLFHFYQDQYFTALVGCCPMACRARRARSSHA